MFIDSWMVGVFGSLLTIILGAIGWFIKTSVDKFFNHYSHLCENVDKISKELTRRGEQMDNIENRVSKLNGIK